MLEFPIRLQYR